MKRQAIEYSRPRSTRRSGGPSCARLAAWLLLIALVVVALGAAAASILAWRQQADELARLRAQVDELAGGAHLAEARATAASLDGRLAAIEQSLALQADASPEPTDEPVSGVPGADASWTLEELAAEQAALAARIEELERQVAAGAIEWDRAQAGVEVAALPARVDLDVETQKQQHNLSCESSAASMAARYHGVDVSEEEILAALPLDDNPYRGFRGNVDGPPGGVIDYGVYAAPVVAVLAGYNLDARMVEGGLAGIQAALARGNPVVAWITYDCLPSTPVTETVGGEPVRLVPYQHAVVVTGYDAGGVWANDPWDGAEEYYAQADFERALRYFGDMAIEVATTGD